MAPLARELTSVNGASVCVRRLIRSYGSRPVLNGLDLEIKKGEFVALLGRSGCGKSTLLRALAALDHDVEGSGELYAPKSLSVIFQDARLLPWKRVLDNVVLGLRGADMRERGRRALTEVELEGREKSWPYELSGGEQQRVALARALVRGPGLLLADEPFGALDALTRLRMRSLLRRLWSAHRPTVLLITHDVDEAIELADRVVVLDSGAIIADIAIERPETDEDKLGGFETIRDDLLSLLGVTPDAMRRKQPA